MLSKDDLEPVNDLKTVQRYLRYGLEFHETVSGYFEEAGLRFEAAIHAVDTSLMTIDLEISTQSFEGFDHDALQFVDQPRAPLRLSYSVNEATFFIQAHVIGRTSRRLGVKAEMPMYKLQRREALRIKLDGNKEATIRLEREHRQLYDLSAGGLSFLASPAEVARFTKGKRFPRCQLLFQSKYFTVDLEVKNILRHVSNVEKLKVGMRFVALPAAVEQMIAREAYLYTHKIWSRWL